MLQTAYTNDSDKNSNVTEGLNVSTIPENIHSDVYIRSVQSDIW